MSQQLSTVSSENNADAKITTSNDSAEQEREVVISEGSDTKTELNQLGSRANMRTILIHKESQDLQDVDAITTRLINLLLASAEKKVTSALEESAEKEHEVIFHKEIDIIYLEDDNAELDQCICSSKNVQMTLVEEQELESILRQAEIYLDAANTELTKYLQAPVNEKPASDAKEPVNDSDMSPQARTEQSEIERICQDIKTYVEGTTKKLNRFLRPSTRSRTTITSKELSELKGILKDATRLTESTFDMLKESGHLWSRENMQSILRLLEPKRLRASLSSICNAHTLLQVHRRLLPPVRS